MIHPHSPDWRALGTVAIKTPQGSFEELDCVGGPFSQRKEPPNEIDWYLCQALIDKKLKEPKDRSKK